MSATSIGSLPVLEFARSMLEIARPGWREHESGNFQRAGAEIYSVRAADCSDGARISAKLVRPGPAEQSSMSAHIDRTIGRAKFSTAGAARSRK
jgi:hypothetical protein